MGISIFGYQYRNKTFSFKLVNTEEGAVDEQA